ncbi:unnamed protein product [Phyllotreta striolata]|uniref:Uncharacterized protein n=1 Tax=Phyllotreta striolata TaxID=444603 RepID=A0A9N9TZ62_PHYSR|nr:unnamed protein product [Phyllotreta striolata]
MGNTQKKSYNLEVTPGAQRTTLPTSVDSKQSEKPAVKVNNEALEVTGVEEDQKLKTVVDGPARTNNSVEG